MRPACEQERPRAARVARVGGRAGGPHRRDAEGRRRAAVAGDRPLRRLPLPARTDNMKGRNGDRLGLYRCRVRHAAGTCAAPATIMARILDPYVEQGFLAALSRMRSQRSRT